MKAFFLALIFISAMQQIAMAEISPSTNNQNYIDQINGQRALIKKEAQLAKSQKDLIKLNCLNDKLNQADSAIKSINSQNLLIVKDRVFKLSLEATSCVGHAVVSPIVANSVQVFIDPNLPIEENNVIDSSIANLPVCVSCIK